MLLKFYLSRKNCPTIIIFVKFNQATYHLPYPKGPSASGVWPSRELEAWSAVKWVPLVPFIANLQDLRGFRRNFWGSLPSQVRTPNILCLSAASTCRVFDTSMGGIYLVAEGRIQTNLTSCMNIFLIMIVRQLRQGVSIQRRMCLPVPVHVRPLRLQVDASPVRPYCPEWILE